MAKKTTPKKKKPTTQPKSGTTQPEPQPEPQEPDEALDALGDLIRLLDPFDDQDRERLLETAAIFYGLNSPVGV